MSKDSIPGDEIEFVPPATLFANILIYRYGARVYGGVRLVDPFTSVA